MSSYRPSSPFVTPIMLIIPKYATVKGVRRKAYPESGPESGPIIWCSFKTYGGTERNKNDVYAIEDTAKVETYFRPDIKADCRIMLAESGAMYDIINEPENINMRNQYCAFKVRRVKGGV